MLDTMVSMTTAPLCALQAPCFTYVYTGLLVHPDEKTKRQRGTAVHARQAGDGKRITLEDLFGANVADDAGAGNAQDGPGRGGRNRGGNNNVSSATVFRLGTYSRTMTKDKVRIRIKLLQQAMRGREQLPETPLPPTRLPRPVLE